MGEFADLKIRGSAAVHLSDDRLRGGIAEVIEPGFDGHFGGGFGEIAEAEEIGVRGGINPDGRLQFGGGGGGLRGVEGWEGGVDNAAQFEEAADCLSEGGGGWVGGV